MNYFDIRKLKVGMRVRLDGHYGNDNHPNATENNYQGTITDVFYKDGRKHWQVKWDYIHKDDVDTGNVEQQYSRLNLAREVWDIGFYLFQKDLKKMLTEE